MLVQEMPGDQDMRTIRYLALGDSYTIGESVTQEERWPNQLAALLEADGIQTEITIIARTGWTTDELWQGIQARELQPPYDLVSLLVGVNNQYRGYDLDEYREQLNFLLGKSIEYAGGSAGRVLVLSIPDWGVTPFAASRNSHEIAKDIDRFNQVNWAEAEKNRAFYVDVTPSSRAAVSDAALVAADGLHPSGKMYAMWAEKALPVVREILGIVP
jgi:lysophospholipase L1-like esterase